MESNLSIWDKLKDVPKQAQKPIKAGRLNGMTDISPQWRYHVMTQSFGPIGIGWKYTIDKQWLDNGSSDQICAMTNISLFVKHEGEWSDAIPGTGGSMLVASERNGLYTSDEAWKMSLTDALSVALKLLGVGAVIYSAGNDYSKYSAPKMETKKITKQDAVKLIKSAQSVDDLKNIWLHQQGHFKTALTESEMSDVTREKDAKKAEFESVG